MDVVSWITFYRKMIQFVTGAVRWDRQPGVNRYIINKRK